MSWQTRLARIKARRQINRELAQADRENRCGICRAPLPTVGAHQRFGDPQRYCSVDCLADAIERSVTHK